MARTFRRQHYVPAWVTEDCFKIADRVAETMPGAHRFRLQKMARRKSLRWWHAETTRFLVRAPKAFRKEYEIRHRMDCKGEIARYLKDDLYEIMIMPKKPLGYWL
jgi:hypothetical protein